MTDEEKKATPSGHAHASKAVADKPPVHDPKPGDEPKTAAPQHDPVCVNHPDRLATCVIKDDPSIGDVAYCKACTPFNRR
jgi:hypothetical protein